MSDEGVDFRFMGRQLNALIEEFRTFRDDFNVLTAIVMRMDGSLSGQLNELRAMHSQYGRLANRMTVLEKATRDEASP